MIMINSKAGQRLAKAKAAYDSTMESYRGIHCRDSVHKVRIARKEWIEAAEQVSSELIADGHADAEDYS